MFFSHFYRAVQINSEPDLAKAWAAFKPRLFNYYLANANAALDDVASGRVFKELIEIHATLDEFPV